MSETWLPYGRQWVDGEDIQSVVDALSSEYLTTGPTVERFEQALAVYTGASHTVVVNSGTSALHAAYFAAGLKPGDEIITSPLTFAATANAALYLGARVRFVDIQPDTGNLDPNLIEALITETTKLIVPVDFGGHPAEYDEINALARRYNIPVASDGAHSLGAAYRQRKVGALADLTATSFHPVKLITTAEGGAVFTNNADWARRAADFRNHGITRDPGKMQRCDGPWYYEMHDLGHNYRLTDIQCALGLSQMRKLDTFIARRRDIAAAYTEALRNVPELIVPVVRDYVESSWHLYVIRVAGDPALRKPFFERLRELGLGVQVHYIPVYYHPYYQSLGYEKGDCPNAEDFYARSISLPIYPKMTDDDVRLAIERVERAVREVLS